MMIIEWATHIAGFAGSIHTAYVPWTVRIGVSSGGPVVPPAITTSRLRSNILGRYVRRLFA